MNWNVFEGTYACCGSVEVLNAPRYMWRKLSFCWPFAAVFAVIGALFGLISDLLGLLTYAATCGFCCAAKRYRSQPNAHGAYECGFRRDYIISARWSGARCPRVCHTDNKCYHCTTYTILCPVCALPFGCSCLGSTLCGE